MKQILRRGAVAGLALLALLVPGLAGADVVLSSEKLNAALKQMQRLQAPRQDAGEAMTDSVFALGEEARALAILMSKEVAAHGWQQKPMLDLALRRTSALGVHIAWSAAHERFFYDGEAYRRYLEAAPEGAHAAESMFQLLWYDFYQAEANDHAALVAQAAYAKEFLRRFPDSANAAEAGLFLAINYRDLWRDCRENAGEHCDGRYAALTREQFRQVATEHAGTDQAEIASRLLQRFDAEAAGE